MALRLEQLHLRLGDFTLDADFEVPARARVAVIGPSGAGKSTLLAAIAGFLKPESGRILWEGRDITALPPGKRPLSILFQDNNLFPHLTARQNAALGIRPSLRLSDEEWARVDTALARVGLAGLGDRRPAALSGGQQGRVALARMLLRRRSLMLLDEPFAALGPALKADMLDLVAEIVEAEGMTALLVSHDPEDARRFAPLTVVVAEGRAAPPAPTEALLGNPPPALAAYLGNGA
ncbi:thiamine transport system ATP-binding protein [Meinhardsimonia xiamenensis]|uniref:Thiamine transport system ATP-binding protein n=1 Tax=Meinhardsimonia xiamenensis TaxID=990712 RepID=A0A1G9DTK3_9RHOB|nr:ATP-binding cassette domain-containing protein [Meinhardsimonia xiamenensis]PRX31208.1 thiamine transport system ATP-binding protein [Meinhardsimonia xiamenensis]SDK67172.1 thiamine transport system ATP-binding protein [Meinhardsimonia xiamenensis]